MFTFSKMKLSILMFAVATLAVGCGSDDSADSTASSGEALVISGSLGSAASNKLSKAQEAIKAMSVSVNDLEVYGLAFCDPPEVQTVELGNDGDFSLTFSSTASGCPISLIFRYDSKSDKAGEQVGVVKFVDTDEKDIDGNASSSSSVALSGTVSLGSLSIDENGDVSVPVAQISSNIANEEVDSASAFDFSGNWTFKKFDGTLPSGYSHVCAASSSKCDGPEADMPIFLKRIAGKKFAANSACQTAAENDTFDASSDTCGGTTGSKDRYMIQVWKSQTAATTCGNKLGFKNEAAKAYARIDFSDSGVTEGEFDWTAGFAEGWKATNARAVWSINNCGPIEVTAADNSKLPGWKCTDTNGNYEIGLEGGCFDSNNNPVHVTDWQNITPDNCNQAAATGLTNFIEDSCTYTNTDPDGSGDLSSMNFTCKHTYGRFDPDDSADTPGNGGDFNWNNVTELLAGESSPNAGDGALCSSITPANDFETVAQLRCYAEHLYRQDLEEDDSKCVRRVEMNWAETNADNFIMEENGPRRAGTLFVLSKFEYDSSSSGYFEDEDVYYNGVQTGNNWTSCKIKDHFRMSIKKRTSTTLVAEFVSEVTLLDTDKEACVADAESENSELEVGVSKSIMLLTK